MTVVSNGPMHVIATGLLDDAKAGTAKPTITELARRAGITRPTLYRNHPQAVADFLAHLATANAKAARPVKPTQALEERIANLRRANEDLQLHIELYEEHIRRLTVENMKLHEKLDQLSNVASLDQRRQARRDGGLTTNADGQIV